MRHKSAFHTIHASIILSNQLNQPFPNINKKLCIPLEFVISFQSVHKLQPRISSGIPSKSMDRQHICLKHIYTHYLCYDENQKDEAHGQKAVTKTIFHHGLYNNLGEYKKSIPSFYGVKRGSCLCYIEKTCINITHFAGLKFTSAY